MLCLESGLSGYQTQSHLLGCFSPRSKMYPRNNWYLKKILVLSDHLYICQSNLTNLATVQLNRGEGSWQQWTWIFPWSIECPRPWPPLLGMCPPSVHFRPYISTCYVNITMPSCLVSWFESQGKRGFALGKRWTVALCTKVTFFTLFRHT